MLVVLIGQRTNLFAVQPTLTVVGTNANLTWTPATDANTSDTGPPGTPFGPSVFRVTLNDNGVINNGGANSTVLTSNLQFVVTSQNDAPVLANITPVLSVDEDQSLGSNTGTTIAALIDNGSITEAKDAVNPGLDDDDTPVEAIAITGTSVSNGTFEFSTNGTDFHSVGSVSASQSLLLDAADKLRFRPNTDFHGTAGTFTFRAWDQRSVSGSSTASAAGTKVL